jgi:arylsulfatase A-like enzyme
MIGPQPPRRESAASTGGPWRLVGWVLVAVIGHWHLPAGCAAGFPNVVVLLADDAGWGDYGASGNRRAHTPHIDALAGEGVSLDRFFVCPVCSPTRAEFLTGRWWPRTGVRGVSTGQERLNLDERTIAEAFHAAGYATGCFGKWHNGSQWPFHPMARGFDTFYGHTSGHWGEYFDPPLERDGRMERAEGYIVDACTSEAINFIHRSAEGPFFCYVPFTTPHSPWAAPAKNWEHFRELAIEQRATQPDKEDVDKTRCALAMLENQDENVGRILGTLERLGLSENTIVVYFSDNGPNSDRWAGGMAGRKGSTDEGGVRSVCFIRWPAGLAAGRRIPQIAASIDLLPTLTSLAGVPLPPGKPLDGRDLAAVLRGETIAASERLIVSEWGNRVSVRSQQYRLDAAGRLFDMEIDPGQKHDIAAQHPSIAAELAAAVAAWRRDVWGDGVERPPGTGVDPRPIGVGYREFPVTMLPARDGEPGGGVRRSGRAPNCSYFVNWNALAGAMTWHIDVQTSGDYDVVIDYTCPPADAGSLVELAFQESRLVGRVAHGWDPPLSTNQDTLPRSDAESAMKEFRPLALGTIQLSQGRGPLVLRAVEMPGRSVMDVRRVTLTLREP